MTHPQSETGEKSYRDSVQQGFYQTYASGVHGKHDNVRRYWEDRVTRSFMRPHLRRIAKRGFRILDLGCGAGQGYELLTRIDRNDMSLDAEHHHLLEKDDIALYFGMDLSEEMIRQGAANYADREYMSFAVGDLRDGLDGVRDEAPFDLYYSSYGSFSHLSYSDFQKLLADVVNHAEDGALLVMDMLGRWSLEWPGYWGAETESEKVRDYSMSYVYDEAQREALDIEHFNIRYWTGDEVYRVCQEVSTSEGRIVPLTLMDRSVMVGRHIDTNEYGAKLPPIRQVACQLHEDNMRTYLENLMVEYEPEPGFPAHNAFFADLTYAWNKLIQFTIRRLHGERLNLIDMDGWDTFHPALQMGIMNMDRVIDSTSWIRFGDARANIIEPQLGYMLLTLENLIQPGQGYGHGLLAVLEVQKSER